MSAFAAAVVPTSRANRGLNELDGSLVLGEIEFHGHSIGLRTGFLRRYNLQEEVAKHAQNVSQNSTITCDSKKIISWVSKQFD
jgi:hypothetical protein